MTQRDDLYVLPSSDAESQRLERQARLYGGVAFLEPFLAADPQTVLDVGCGTGHFARHVAAQMPSATVVGVDLDAARLSLARSSSDAANLDFAEGDIGALPFEDGRFELVYSRFLLEHLPDPVAALVEMARVTRPGGRVVALDLVHEGIWFSPPKPAFAEVLATAIAALREQGADPNLGLALPACMKRARLRDVTAEVMPHYAMSPDPLFEAHRDNWLETVRSLASTMGSRFDDGLVEAAETELQPSADDQFVVEIAVLAHGRKAVAP